jgi:hypothetical protein
MHLSVERSAATAAPILPAGTVWSQMQSGLTTFYSTPVTNAFGTLSFFPDAPTAPAVVPDCNTTTCGVAPSLCSARVPFNALNQSSFQTAVTALSPSAAGPPTSAAYDGMIATATPYTSSLVYLNDTHISVLVLASDVATAGCNPSVTTLAAAAANALAMTKIRTYVIGIGVPSSTTSTIAAAGGGQAFNLVANSSLGTNLAATLNSIRQNLFPCSFALPAPGLFDPTNPYLAYISGMPPTAAVQTQVANLAACPPTGGYYYDNNANPTQVLLCPNLCAIHRATLYSTIKLVISCPTTYQAWSAPPQVYQGTCPPGTQVQWGLFGYDASAPGNSNIVFKVQAATTQAGLVTAPLITLATARSTPTDTQVCPVPKIPAQMPPPTCAPIDLFAKLGGLPAARYDFLQLSMDFTPNSLLTATPTVSDWQITYSCPADQ